MGVVGVEEMVTEVQVEDLLYSAKETGFHPVGYKKNLIK